MTDLDDAIAVESEQRDGCLTTVVYTVAAAFLWLVAIPWVAVMVLDRGM